MSNKENNVGTLVTDNLNDFRWSYDRGYFDTQAEAEAAHQNYPKTYYELTIYSYWGKDGTTYYSLSKEALMDKIPADKAGFYSALFKTYQSTTEVAEVSPKSFRIITWISLEDKKELIFVKGENNKY